MEEALATKIKCEWCHREIWVPHPSWSNNTKDEFYCASCGQYTKVNGGGEE